MTVRLSTTAFLVAVVALGFLIVPQWRDLNDAHQRRDDRETALSVATAEVAELTTLSPDTLDKQLKSLNGRLTESFSQQFQAMYSTFASVVSKEKVTSKGSIQSAGLVSSTDRRAVALVAARAVVTSPENEKGVNRAYRFEVSLTKQDSGWLVSGMRFVS